MVAYEISIYHAVVISAATVGLVGFFLVRLILRSHKKQLHTIGLMHQIETEVLMEERRRIADDLHDEQAPKLLMTRQLIGQLKPSGSDEEKILNTVSMQLNEIMGSFRNTIYNLRPETILRKGLKEALKDLLEDCLYATGIQYQLEFKIGRKLPEDLKISLYMIFQELVHNVIKHAEAGYILIKLKEHRNLLYIVFRDNGKGFSDDQHGGMGIKSVQMRIEKCGGFVEINYPDTGGMEYYFELPLTEKS